MNIDDALREHLRKHRCDRCFRPAMARVRVNSWWRFFLFAPARYEWLCRDHILALCRR